VSPSGLSVGFAMGPVAHATGRDISPSGLHNRGACAEQQGLTPPAGYFALRAAQSRGLCGTASYSLAIQADSPAFSNQSDLQLTQLAS